MHNRGVELLTLNNAVVRYSAVPPSVEIFLVQNSTVFNEGDSVMISCNASGVPTPTINLYKVTLLYSSVLDNL